MERENLLVRQQEGIAIEKNKGVRFGRPPREKPKNTDEYVQMYKNGDISLRKAAEAVGVPKTTFENWAKE